ncbi:hypothetical protein BRADI_3g30033v3 [Brachypodium distachyon]|uniref:Uncharacterized protein n=1 Tax=Brachypodium distachyon TaxID=15368 RepID=A0A2K2D036_BRADI|nr:hypothetical protein BRADI_3g30033v3 [Brachypodium distachyon]
MRGGMKKGKWSKEEDNLIKNHIEKYGIGRSWQGLSNTLGLQRCGRSCRSRWLNYLRPGLKHGNFTAAEERIICEMYSKRGSCWSIIAAVLPGRTDLAIKNYWNSTLKKRFPRAARSRRRTSSDSSDDTGPDLTLVVYNDDESTSTTTAPDLALIVYNEEEESAAEPELPLVVYNEEEESAAAPELPLVLYNEEESATAGSSSSHSSGVDKPVAVLSGSQLQAGLQPPPPICAPVQAGAQPSPPPVTLVKEELISAPVRTSPVDYHQTGEEMDVGWALMSPMPLSYMDPDLARIIGIDLPPIAGFEDIGSFLSFFN